MFQDIKLSSIRPNPDNPRKKFEGVKFEELVASIRQCGVIEPVLVRPAASKECSSCGFKRAVGNSKKGVKIPWEHGKCIRPEGLCKSGDASVEFELIAGERRWRASCVVASENGGPDNHTIPAIVKDVDDDTAFDLMTIENLQREDLNELEEARGFETYVRRRGNESIPELAERCGLNARYIRRRLAVLSLPEEILRLWSDGSVRYGHMEQFLRVKDSGDLLPQFAGWVVNSGWSVNTLKEHIDRESLSLSKAVFDINNSGCPGCSKNTETQKSLFGMDSDTAKCLDPKCFKQQVNNFLLKNWKTIGEKYKTTGFRFMSAIEYSERNMFSCKPKKTCHGCENFVSLVRDDGIVFYDHICIGPPACFKKTYSPSTSGNSDSGNGDGPRVKWHGTYFREQFYQQALPVKFDALPAQSEQVLRLALFSFVKKMDRPAHAWFAERHNISIDDHEWFYLGEKELMGIIEKIPSEKLSDELKAVVVFAMTQPDFGVISRHLVSGLAGINLSEEWLISEEYLKKKTRQELIDLGQTEINGRQPVFVRDEAMAFLQNVLGRPDGRFDLCKKPDLVRVFMESGADLSGLVPDEVLRADEYNPHGHIN